MAHGVLREFDPLKESVEDFRERFDFYCLANKISGEGEAARRKQALFLTLLGQSAFTKLKTLVSPTLVSELTLDQVMEHLIGHYKPQTIEIAERFKFFRRHQLGGESTTDFMSELRRLAKTCNFGNYLETAIRDQFVCGLRNTKTQRELLCVPELTAQIALHKARAAEAVYKETLAIKGSTSNAETHSIRLAKACNRCGKTDHMAVNCKFKTAKCHFCQKIGHLARVCMAKNRNKPPVRTDATQAKAETKKPKNDVHQLETVDPELTDSSSEDDHLHTILQLGGKSDKFLYTATINGIEVEMELDSGADRSTVPWTLFQAKLAGVCKLMPTNVALYQYDKSHLKIKGQCKVTVQVLGRKIVTTLIVVDVNHQVPLFGRDWMVSFGLDLPTIFKQTLQVCHAISSNTVIESFVSEFRDVFKEELGILQGIEATIELNPTAVPRFCKNRPVPFALKEKVETLLKAQVAQGELRPVDRSDWATPIVVVPKSDRGIRICGDFKVTINPVICPQVFPLPTPEEMFSALANG